MISAWTNRDKIQASYRRNGALEIKTLGPAEYVGFVRDWQVLPNDRGIIDRRPDFPGWWRFTWRDYESRKLSVEQNPGIIYEGDVSPVRRFLSDNYCKIDPPLRAYFDFETDSRVSPKLLYSAVPQAGRLLSWAVAGEDGKREVTVLEDDDDQAEAELWAEHWRYIGEYDQLAAWNCDRFDDRVRELRCRLLAQRFPKILEPYWEHRRRLLFVDQLLCFKRHHMAPESGDDKTSLKLNDVCQSIIGQGKNDFDARHTWDAWAAGGAERQRLAEYNLQDTLLLPKLEAATGYLELQQTLAEVTLTFANTHGLKPMPQVDGYMLRKAHLDKTHLPSKKPPTGAEEQYEGAFVLKPSELGLHRCVHVCDFKSLYPTVIRTFNISPETKGQGDQRCTAFRTGIEFNTAIEGMLPAACRTAMELRDYWKKKAKENPDDKSAERKSKAYKIFNNSMYGVIGSAWSRYYDVQIAESVTLGAKHLNEATAEAAKARGWKVIYMDTDSLFVTGCSVEEFKVFVDTCNAELYPKLLDAQNCPRPQQCIALDYEKAFDVLVFPLGNKGVPAAKRYFGSYLHYAFKPKSKPEVRGLEYMRGDGTRMTRHMQKQCIDMILSGMTDAEKLEEWVLSRRTAFMNEPVELEDIVISQSVSRDLADYKAKGAHIRIAEEMEEAGEDVSAGTRIAYVVTDGSTSPVVAKAANDYNGEFDRVYYWSKKVYPATMRVLAGAFPNRNWKRWLAKRPKPVLPGQLKLIA